MSTQALRPTIPCPHCSSTLTVKMGFVKSNNSQRYKCKCCNKTFTESTNKITSHSHKPSEVWSTFITCFLHKDTLRETAETCGINLHTAFNWRHKILDALQSMQDNVTLSNDVQADETYFALSYKGCKNEKMPRDSHKRGKSLHIKGLSKEQVCVVCSVDKDNHSIGKVAKLGKAGVKAIKAVLDNHISANSTLITDSHSSYRKFAKSNNLNLIQIPRGKHTNGAYNIQKINSYHSELKRLITGTFKGVATKYLNNYIVYHNFVTIAKDGNKMQILKDYLSKSFCMTKGYEITMRNPVPVLV